MLVAPCGTDAPIYHRPIATASIIIINVIVFCLTTLQLVVGDLSYETIDWLILDFERILPTQWITSAFMHAGPGHLIGNMLFLWAFGLVTEGKIGSLRFAGIYILMAAVQGALIQISTYCLGMQGGALGASGVIFSLIAIALLWAPENEIECFYWVGWIFYGTFELRIVTLSMIYMGLQIVVLSITGFAMSSELLHAVGFFVGAPVGWLMLRRGLVDCEGWDLLSRNPWLNELSIGIGLGSSTRQPQVAKAKAKSKSQSAQSTNPVVVAKAGSPKPTGSSTERSSGLPLGKQSRAKKSQASGEVARKHPEFNRLRFQLHQSVERGDATGAQDMFYRIDQAGLINGLSTDSLFAFVQLLGRSKKWADTLRPLRIIAASDGPRKNEALLYLAQVQLKVNKNPTAAIDTLRLLCPLPEQPSSRDRAIHNKAKLVLKAAQRQAKQSTELMG